MKDIFLYIIEADEYCKVGISNNPKKRLGEVSTGCPFKPKIVFFKKVSNTMIIESRCHDILKPHNTNGEWFKIKAKACKDIVETVINKWEYKEPTVNVEPLWYPSPNLFTEEEAKLFVETKTKDLTDDQWLLERGIPLDKPKAWKHKTDFALKQYYTV